MEDKTPIYMVLTVGVVAFIAIIIMLMNSPQSSGDALTGNIVADNTDVSIPFINNFGRIFFGVFLLGIAGYMYFKNE